jgi:hypothetical protein
VQELENNTEKIENNIKDILEKTENDIKEGKITRRSGGSGSEEFVFSGDGTGLVFDKELPTKQISDTSKILNSETISPFISLSSTSTIALAVPFSVLFS